MAIYTATTGVDNLSGTTDWDTFVIGADVMLQAGDVFNGGSSGFNDIRLDATGAGAHSWLFYLATFSNFEAVTFNPDSAGTLTVYAYANQFGAGPNAAALVVTGSALTSDNIDITFTVPASYNFNTWTFSNWQSGPDGIFLRGSDAGADTIGGTSQTDDIFGNGGDDVLSGNGGADYMVGGAGNDTIDGGDGNDVAQYASAASSYYVYTSGGGLVVVDITGAEGTDTVLNTQFLRFVATYVDTTTFTANEAATASITGPYVIQQGEGVAISATANDADIAENDAITYAWDLDNDGQFDDSTTLSPTLTAGNLATLGIDTVGDHTLSLRVTDRAGVATTVTTTLTVEAVAAPVISSDGGAATASVSVAENTTAVTTVVATDANTGDVVTYSISGGADSALFAIDSGTGALSFVAAPNYEAPGDVGGDNSYEVIVSASDGVNTDTQTITVTVTDTADVVNGTAGDDAITAGPAGGTYNLLGGADSFTGSAAADLVTGGAGNDAINGGGDTDTAAFSGARANYYIYTSGADVVVHDLTGADGTDTLSNVENLQFTDGTIASTGFTANEAPVASAGGPYLAQIGDAVVISATASDADTTEGDVITYAWDLDNDGQFDDSTTLSPTLSADDLTTLGINTAGDHTLSLRVTDATGVATTVTATLTLEAVAAPVISSDGGAATAAVSVAENATAVTTVVATDANTGDVVTYSISGGADSALFAIDSGTGALSFVAAPNYEAPGDVGGDNGYEVTVTASDGVNTDTQTITVTVTDTADVVNGTAGDDAITAGPAGGTYNLLGGADSFTGSAAADLVTGGAGNDAINGGGDTDTAAFTGARANYYIYTSGADVVVHDLTGADGTDTLSNVENLQFTDGTIGSTGFTANEAPVASAGGPYYAQEGQAVVINATASDADTAEGDVIAYAWDLDNDGQFDDSTTLSPTLSGVDIANLGLGVGDHTITLRVTDAAGVATDSAITLTIAASAAPVISSDGGGATASLSVAENTTAVTTAVASDANLNDTVTYSLTGDDAALFTIDANTGVLAFIAAPNHEAPADVGTDNAYHVTVVASDDGLLTDTQDVTITVTDTFDDVFGTAGADTVDGGTGADRMLGGDGNDIYYVDDFGDVVVEALNEGVDEIRATSKGMLSANVENLTLLGTAALNGTGNELDNIITGNSGANRLNGLAGADAMSGGDGDDIYYVDNAGDTATELDGQGVDRVDASVSFTLSTYVETLVLTGAADINGDGNAQDNTIQGNSGANVLHGGDGVDTLKGMAGADTLDGGAGADRMMGGDGNDTYYVDAVGDMTTEGANEGADTVMSAIGRTLGANIENLTLLGTAAINGIGNELDNILTGNSGANRLSGMAGADSMIGGDGDDIYYVDNAGDTITELDGQGADRVDASVSFTLSAYVETLVLTGAGDINGDGNAQDNTIQGNSGANVLNGGAGVDMLKGMAGADTLDGGAGADRMMGGDGDDTYYVDVASDMTTENANQGSDTVISAVGRTLGANLENLTLLGTAAINGSGNELDNILTGNSGANRLSGMAGADSMIGGDGDDIYYVDNAGDTITELDGQGADRVDASVSFTLSAYVETLVLTGAGDINGDGNAQDNTIQGNSGANVLNGGAGVDMLKGMAGADTLDGGIGNDTLYGGTGSDAFIFAAHGAGNWDVIGDYNVAADHIELDDAAFVGIGAAGANLSASQFCVGSAAADGDDHIIYNNATGALYYDADGAGGAAQVQFAQVTAGLALTSGEFLIV